MITIAKGKNKEECDRYFVCKCKKCLTKYAYDFYEDTHYINAYNERWTTCPNCGEDNLSYSFVWGYFDNEISKRKYERLMRK